MTKTELNDYKKLLSLKKLQDERLRRMRSDIDILDKRIASAASVGQYRRLVAIKRERVEEAELLLCEIENKTLAIQRELRSKWEQFTPLEALIIQNIYIDGMSWKEFEGYVYAIEELRPFRYEHSTYMNAHRNALDKLGIPKTGRGGRPRVQKANGD